MTGIINKVKNVLRAVLICAVISLIISACWQDLEEISVKAGGGGPAAEITIAAINGVTPPAFGQTPVTGITETAQYTGTVSWSPAHGTFAATTVYTATITLTAKEEYTLTGVAEDFFTVAGAASGTNSADSGVITAVFPATGSAPPTVINIAAVPGVTPPVLGGTPVTTLAGNSQYTGTVSWSGTPVTFAAATVYTATITLTPKSGYTFTGVAANFFTVAGASTDTNPVNSGVVTAVFPATGLPPINIAGIGGVTVPVLGEIPATTVSETAQYTGTVTWDGGWSWSSRFGGNKAYTATITLTAKSGYTLTGVAANFFTVAGSTSDTNSASSGVITAVFPTTVTVAIGNSILGGKVAYILINGDPGYVAGEQRGLIAATADQSGGLEIIWAITAYQLIEVTGGADTAFGAGFSNTYKIVNQNEAGSTYAAGLCDAYTNADTGTGVYTDWYLPSLNELIKLYNNRTAIGGFSSTIYWSSSEYSASEAHWYNFGTASAFHSGKSSLDKVRAVRSF